MNTDLVVETISRADGIIIALIGAADLGGSEKLDRQLMIVSAQHPKNIVFDLSRMTFISSLCMGSLVRFQSACRHWGGKVRLAAASPDVAGALLRARLNQVLPMTNSVEEAFAA
ncbi:MAG TPA: STAS domain-containing protein [Tepidisphaeraceae bacterium]|nr:STAS domain-containing protein [Tepidisphaeraceae bacterium]